MKYKNILDTIGNTPMIAIQKLSPYRKARILAKLERGNPSGSVKDRVAKYLIEDAEKRGLLENGKTILEATSGNTGIGLAMIATFKGYNFTAVMPKNVSSERIKLLKAYGAKIVFSEANKGTNGSIVLAKKMTRRSEKYIMLDQYNNPANVLAHYETTGREIVGDINHIDIFVAGMGTGGTLMGIAKRLRESYPKVKIVGVEPYENKAVSGLRNMRAYKPDIFDEKQLDSKIAVGNQDAMLMARQLFLKEGISAGISSGAVMWVALKMAKKIKKGTIVVLFPDGGERYLSTEMFE